MSQQMQFTQTEQGSSYTMTSHSTPAGLMPDSPDTLNMDPFARSADTESFDSYALASLEFSGFRSVGNSSHGNQSLHQDRSRNAAALPMDQFMRDGPWDPLRASAGARPAILKSKQPGLYPMSLDYPCYSDFRDTAAQSDCDDSAYYSVAESMARQSVVNPSVYGDLDRATDTQSFVQPFQELHLQSQHSQGPDSASVVGEHLRGEPWNHHRPVTNPDASHLICPTCNNRVKTNAELNKHKLRHEKPFRCDVPGCGRKQGFGTSNDLARHQQSVHSASGTKYRCHLDQCRTKIKDWPRADNFKQHLKRVHGISNVSEIDLREYEHKPAKDQESGLLGSAESQADLADQTDTSSWMGLDQSQEPPDLPSGEIGFSQMDQRLDPHSQEPAREETRSSLLDARETGHRTQPSSDDRLQIGTHSGIPGLEIHRSQAPEDRTVVMKDLYKEVNPAGLFLNRHPNLGVGVHGQVSRTIEGTQCGRGEDGSGKHPRGEGPFARPQQSHTLLEAGGNIVEEKDLRPRDLDRRVDDETEDDTADAVHDAEAILDPCQIKSSHSPLHEGDQATPVTPPAVDLLADDESTTALLQSLLKRADLDKVLLRLGYHKAKEEDMAKDDPSKPPASGGKDGSEVCQECSKRFKRPCELKKHMKRHEKPYACTHEDCDRNFGSKNDWKRHENSQHIQLEFWKCTEKLKDGGSCGVPYHRRDSFKHHLDKDHGIHDQAAVDARCNEARNGRNFEARFWCGFCAEIIDLGKTGGLAWSQRFDHIDEHFTGKNSPRMEKKDWKSIQSQPFETFKEILPGTRSPTEASPSRARADDDDAAQAGRDASSRKRLVDNDDGPSSSTQSKRTKLDRGHRSGPGKEPLWFCCGCGNFWGHAITTKCLELGCQHDFCSRCRLEVGERSRGERPPRR